MLLHRSLQLLAQGLLIDRQALGDFAQQQVAADRVADQSLTHGFIHRNDAEGKGRVLLVRIMDTIVNKFVTLKDRIPKLLMTYKAHTDRAASSARAHLNANGEPSDGVRAASPARIH